MKRVIEVSETLYKTCKRLVDEGDPRPSESCIAASEPYEPQRAVGEWVILPPCFEEICYCTNCGKMFKQMLQFTKECPNCHAYMKGIKK